MTQNNSQGKKDKGLRSRHLSGDTKHNKGSKKDSNTLVCVDNHPGKPEDTALQERLSPSGSNAKKVYSIEDVKDMERLDYNAFRRWLKDKPLKHPQTAITASLARWIALLVYENLCPFCRGEK
jgi:hypothetical protein